jgi:hypothetical protein
METNTKHNIFKDYTIYKGRIIKAWRTSAAKAPKYYNANYSPKFTGVPANTWVYIIKTECGKEIRIADMYMLDHIHKAEQAVFGTLENELGLAGGDFAYDQFQEIEKSETREFKLHNVWFPQDNPSKGYATMMPKDKVLGPHKNIK